MIDLSVVIGLILVVAILTSLFKIWYDSSDESITKTIETDKFSPIIQKTTKRKDVWEYIGTGGLFLTAISIIASSLFVIWLLGTIINSLFIDVITVNSTYVGSKFALVVFSVLSFAIAIVIHEFGHGIYVSIADKIPTAGCKILVFFPIVAYMKQNDNDVTLKERLHIISGGITFNIASILIASIILFLLVIPSIAAVSGGGIAHVVPNSGFDNADIEAGDVIVSINGDTVENDNEAEEMLNNAEGDVIDVTLNDGTTKEVNKDLRVVNQYTSRTPFSEGTVITQVNGEDVKFKEDVKQVVGDEPNADITTASGTSFSTTVGILWNGGENEGTITHINDERVHDSDDLESLDDTYADQEVTVRFIESDGEQRVVTVAWNQLTEETTNGMSGVELSTYGVDFHQSQSYLDILSSPDNAAEYTAESTNIPQPIMSIPGLNLIALIIALPLLLYPTTNMVPYSFVGFTGIVQNFYESTGMLSFLGDGVLVIATFLIAFIMVSILTIVINAVPMRGTDGWKISYCYLYKATRYARGEGWLDEVTNYGAKSSEKGNGNVILTHNNKEMKITEHKGLEGLRYEDRQEYFDPLTHSVMDKVGQVFAYSLLIIAFWIII